MYGTRTKFGGRYRLWEPFPERPRAIGEFADRGPDRERIDFSPELIFARHKPWEAVAHLAILLHVSGAVSMASHSRRAILQICLDDQQTNKRLHEQCQ